MLSIAKAQIDSATIAVNDITDKMLEVPKRFKKTYKC